MTVGQRVVRDIASMADWRSRAVLQRNALVYFRNWKTAFFPPAMEPIVFFLAFGLGVGGYVGALQYNGSRVGYATYVSPGLVAYTAFATPFFEALYSSYVRMFYQKTWDGILATQVELQHIFWGEVLWAGFRGALNAVIVCAVLAVFHLAGAVHIDLAMLPLLPLMGVVAGWAFGAFALVFTAIVPSIDHMNYPVFLIGIPLGLVSDTYFPVTSNHSAIQVLVAINPVSWLARAFRALLLDAPAGHELLGLAACTAAWLVVFAAIGQTLLRRRVLS